MEDRAELESVIRSLLISTPKVLKANRLESDFYETEGRRFPYRNLGFVSFLDYLKSIPHVVQLVPFNSCNPDVLPIVTKEISHIDKLVSKQRNTVPSRKRVPNRRCDSFRPSGIPPPRRRPPAIYRAPEPRPTPNKGVYVSEIENDIKNKYSREDLRSNGIHSANDVLKPMIGNNMVQRVNDKVYTNLSYYPEMAPATKMQIGGQQSSSYPQMATATIMPTGGQQSSAYPQMTTATIMPTGGQQSSGIPAGMEDDSENESEYEDYEDNNLKYSEVYDMKYDEALFDNLEEEAVSNYTIQRCTESLLNSKREIECSNRDNELEDVSEEVDSDDHESNFSNKMISNFRFILAKYPEGVWATELPQKYFEEFKATLDLQSLGYTSAVEMASYLPNVFIYVRSGSHDWKLYDASLYQEKLNELPVKAEETYQKGNFENYVPKSILENIRLLLEQRPEGIKSTDLLYCYEKSYHKNLDLETLGFKQLEDFLEILKQVITVRKAISHYLLLPKHKTVSLDMFKQNECEELKIPMEHCEFLGPENVLKPNDVIPPQELPPLNVKNPLEPMISMEVRLGEVMSPSLFYLMLDSNYLELQSMMDDLHKFYEQEESNYHILLPYLQVNLFCACKYENLWHRAVVTGIRKSNVVEVEYIDYGTPAKVKTSDLRFLQSDFAKLPAQAICAKLLGLVPKTKDRKWSDECRYHFLEILSDKRLLADVYRIEPKKKKEDRIQLEVILYDTNGRKDVVCNDYLVEKGYAEYINDQETHKDEEVSLNQKAPSIDIQYPNLTKEEDIRMNQNISTSSHSPLVQTNKTKPLSRIPPGFEANFNPGQVQTQEVWCPPNSGYMQPPLQQHWQINNILVAPQNNNIRQQLQNLMQNPQFFNIPQLQYQANQYNNWPQIPFLQPAPNYVPNVFPPPVQNCIPSSTPNYYQNQMYVSPEMNTNFTRNNYNVPYNSKTADYGPNKVPGYSGDLSVPLHSPPLRPIVSPPIYQQKDLLNTFLDPTSISRIVPSPPQHAIASPPIFLQKDNQNKFSDPTSISLVEAHEDQFSPNLMKAPSIPELLPTLSDVVEIPKSSYLDNSVSFEKEVGMESNKLKSISDTKNTSKLESLFDSAVGFSKSEKITELNNNFQSLTIINEGVDARNDVPESWEELIVELDDTPAKVDNFTEDFKTPIDDLGYTKPNPHDTISSSLKTDAIKTGKDLLQSDKLKGTINWKDIFNPDSTNTERNNILNTINTNLDAVTKETGLIKKLELKDKFFHVIQVNNKPAVISQEFYPQFIKELNWHVINKIVESKYKPFVVVLKKENPELFEEFEKVELYGEIKKKLFIKIGKASISYLSEIPAVFSVLSVIPDPGLLDKLQNIEGMSSST